MTVIIHKSTPQSTASMLARMEKYATAQQAKVAITRGVAAGVATGAAAALVFSGPARNVLQPAVMPTTNPLQQMMMRMMMMLGLASKAPTNEASTVPKSESVAAPSAPEAGDGTAGGFEKSLEENGRADFEVEGETYAVVKSDSDSGYSAHKVNDDGSLGEVIDENVQPPDSNLGVEGFYEVGGIEGIPADDRVYIGNTDSSQEAKVIQAEAGLDEGHEYREAHGDMIMKSGTELDGGATKTLDVSQEASYALDNMLSFETAMQGDRNKQDDYLGTNDLEYIIASDDFTAEDKAAAEALLYSANTQGKNGYTKEELEALQG